MFDHKANATILYISYKAATIMYNQKWIQQRSALTRVALLLKSLNDITRTALGIRNGVWDFRHLLSIANPVED